MTSSDQKPSENNLLFFISLVFKNWKFLTGLYLLVGIVTVVILLLIPKWYKSEARIVILESNSAPLSGILSEFSAFGLNVGGGINVETYMGYLNTSKMYDRLIREFNLDDVYETTFREDTYELIFQNMGVSDNEDRTFSISYLYKEDPDKAARIVTFLYNELNAIALEVDKAQASNYRNYIESYYKQVRSDLKLKEDSLIQYQETTGIYDLGTQIEVTIQGLAELETQKIALEIEKDFINSSFASNSQTAEIDRKISAISDKISELRSDQRTAFITVDSIPAKGAEFLRLRRDILVGEKVSEFLRLQFEQALLDEQKITSNLYMVDPPKVAEKKSKPQRTKILVVVMFFTVIISLIYIRLADYYLGNKELILKSIKEGA